MTTTTTTPAAVADPRGMDAAFSTAMESLVKVTKNADSSADVIIAHVRTLAEVQRSLSEAQWEDLCKRHPYGAAGALSGSWLKRQGAGAWTRLAAVLDLPEGETAAERREGHGDARALVMGQVGVGAKARRAIMSQYRGGAASRAALDALITEWQADGTTLPEALDALAVMKAAPQAKAPAKPAPVAPVAPESGDVAPVAPVGRKVPTTVDDRVSAALSILRAIARDGQKVTRPQADALAESVARIIAASTAPATV
jgi:hypothetical protein